MRSVNAHIWKLSSVYAHVGFRKCAFMEANMCIYGREIYESQNVHIWKISSVYAHFGFRKCASFPSVNACIYGSSLLYMCIYESSLPYMRSLDFANVHI
jgi:hypothetical protein